MEQSYLERLNNTKKEYPNFWNWKKDSELNDKLKKNKQLYKFDTRDCWCLNQSFYVWLYERLCCFLDDASNVIDLTYYEIEYENEVYTLLECIQKMIQGCEVYFCDPDPDNENVRAQKEIKSICEIWALVVPYMWW